jgi:hypothetical protein
MLACALLLLLLWRGLTTAGKACCIAQGVMLLLQYC